MCRVDPEIKCPDCGDRMYLDDFSDEAKQEGERWVCMNKDHCGKITKIET